MSSLTPTIVRASFGLGVLATVGVRWVAGSGSSGGGGGKDGKGDDKYTGLQKSYLAVYLLAMMADWLQGPFVYALYEAYGYSQKDNAMLFVCGFGSSAVFGTFVGSWADQYGRRRFAALYCITYIISCMTKHFNSFPVLLIGRVTGGIATSLLSSVFDAWLVSEHINRGFQDLLGNTFSLAFFSNSIVAIAAGEVGQIAADALPLGPVSEGSLMHFGGYCSPFDVSMACLVLCLVLMLASWPENYGHKTGGGAAGGLFGGVSDGLAILRQQPEVLCCGLVCAFFEASMFIFVFMWTPALTVEGLPRPPYGHIFASFMVMSMLGSQLFSYATKFESVEVVGRQILAVAATCNLVPIATPDPLARFLSFLLFELCVGMYFPMMGTMKGRVVPEESRSAIYNLYRVPLNGIVVFALWAKIDMRTAFITTSILLTTSVILQTRLIGFREVSRAQEPIKDVEMAETAAIDSSQALTIGLAQNETKSA